MRREAELEGTRNRAGTRRGLALLEALVAVLIIGVVLVALIQIRNLAIRNFLTSSDQYTASWLAELLMEELLSQDFPDPEDEATWVLSGEGDFGHVDEKVNAANAVADPDWTDRRTFSTFTYRWTKELLFVGSEFTGDRDALEEWEAPQDANGEEADVDSPLEKPAVRIVRVVAEVFLPERRGQNVEPVSREERGTREAEGPGGGAAAKSIKLVTYFDPREVLESTSKEEDTTGPVPDPAPTGGDQ